MGRPCTCKRTQRTSFTLLPLFIQTTASGEWLSSAAVETDASVKKEGEEKILSGSAAIEARWRNIKHRDLETFVVDDMKARLLSKIATKPRPRKVVLSPKKVAQRDAQKRCAGRDLDEAARAQLSLLTLQALTPGAIPCTMRALHFVAHPGLLTAKYPSQAIFRHSSHGLVVMTPA
eukprot:2946326-Amphidinium_carterae.4